MPYTVGATLDIVAHQGGWDEILMVVTPLLLLWGLLMLANRRAQANGAAHDAAAAESEVEDTSSECAAEPSTDDETGRLS